MYINGGLSLNDKIFIHPQETIYKISGFGHQHFNCAEPNILRDILALCASMADRFEDAVVWGRAAGAVGAGGANDGFLPMVTAVDAPVSPELVTFDYAMRTFHESFDAYPFGEEIIKEFVLFRMGVPYSKSFLSRCFLVVADRYRFVLRRTGTAFQTRKEEEGMADQEGDFGKKLTNIKSSNIPIFIS